MIWAENIEPVIPEEAKHTTNGQNFKPWEPQILVTVSSKVGASARGSQRQAGRAGVYLEAWMSLARTNLQSLKIHNCTSCTTIFVHFFHFVWDFNMQMSSKITAGLANCLCMDGLVHSYTMVNWAVQSNFGGFWPTYSLAPETLLVVIPHIPRSSRFNSSGAFTSWSIPGRFWGISRRFKEKIWTKPT